MMILDRDIERAQALVIDGNPTSRSIIMNQLRELGVGSVVQAPRLADGRQKLEAKRYDIVVCEQTFPGDDQTGQDLLDDLRRSNLLPYSTVFVMITSEARYEHVAEAAESALDCYLLKPYAASTLAERLRQARHRKRVLGQIFAAIENEQFELAAKYCLDRFAQKSEFWLYAARIGAELLLRTNRHEMAGKLYHAIIEAKAVPWAKLGVARAQADAGQIMTARRTLDTLVSAEPGYADAWDVMGRVQIEQGQFDEALETFRKAAAITPGSIPRLQKQGMLAYYQGHSAEADRLLDRAALLGISSKMFDQQSLVVLAFARFQNKDGKGLQRCRENLEHLAGRDEATPRVQRFARVAQALDHLLAKRLAVGLDLVSKLAHERREPDLDVEGGCNLLSLVAELAAGELKLDGMETWVSDLAVRFSTSRAVSELLTRSAARHPPFADLVNQGHARVLALSEEAMNHALEGDPGTAVRKLLDHAESTLNAKMVDTAKLTLQRHRARIDDAETLDARIAVLKERYAASWAAPRLGQGTRAAGGLTLRDGSPAAQTQAREGIAAVRTDLPAPADAPAA
jgi:CheY-like chemotaxis protein/cytochrome c-type biogenesis protein CcmH/NrfG